MSLSYLDAAGAVADDSRAGASSAKHPVADLRREADVLCVDPSVLQSLAEQLGSREIASRFARDYARLWERRQRSLEAALERRDREAALDAVLSLKASSAMVGAVRLAGLAGRLELIIRGKGDLQGSPALLLLMAEQGSATVQELQDSSLRSDLPGN